MGNPLGPCFSNYYTTHVEKKLFDKVTKPKIYVPCADIFFLAEGKKQIENLKTTFEKNILKFTYELSQRKKFPFLNVLVE